MAQRSIREFDAKHILQDYLPSRGYAYKGRSVLVSQANPLEKQVKRNAWLKKERLVAKIDQLVGKRGKNNLVLLNASLPSVKKFISRHLGKKRTIGKATGTVTHFLVEPFVAHEREYFFALHTEREHTVVQFSTQGGIDIEDAWDSVKSLHVPVGEKKITGLKKLLKGVPEKERSEVEGFIRASFALFNDLGFAYIEMNPTTVAKGTVIPLAVVGRLDDTASYEAGSVCPAVAFPSQFSRKALPEEKHVRALDEQSGASLKLRILNPKGRVWTMVAGGGASVIYADTIADLGFGKELANYGEYSGDPSEELTCEYAKTVLGLMLKNKKVKDKVLFIGGGIANFTDVAATFAGIIRALKEKGKELKKQRVRIFVRRGGPNYEQGLALMRETGGKLGVPMVVHGPEALMTNIVSEALARRKKNRGKKK